MVIEVNIADNSIENGRVVDWSDPERIEIIGYDYAITAEDADDDELDRDEAGLQRYVSSVVLAQNGVVAGQVPS